MTTFNYSKNMFPKNGRWRQLSSKEFEKLNQYLLYRSKKLKEVFNEFEEGGQLAPYRINGEVIGFDGFKALLDFYLDTDMPKDLCLHLFNTFAKESVIDESMLQSSSATASSKLSEYLLASIKVDIMRPDANLHMKRNFWGLVIHPEPLFAYFEFG
ncbi:hypothetical protein D918_07323 [Trichuris suis]|nr:hypothetical protein D918_07323 [Trichuris suis]